jgi:hypothetical protein
MKNFIELTHYNTGTLFTLAVHAIGVFETSGKKTNVTLSFGSSGKEVLEVRESYADIQRLIQEAQIPYSN